METIDKLVPPGLLDTRILARLIACLLGVVEAQLAGAMSGAVSGAAFSTRKVLKLSRLIGRLSRQHRRNINYNLNLKIKVWVLADPARVLWVRNSGYAALAETL